MLTIFAPRTGTPMGQNAATKIPIKCVEDFPAQDAEFVLKEFFPAILEFVSVMVYQPIERGLLGASPSVAVTTASGLLP